MQPILKTYRLGGISLLVLAALQILAGGSLAAEASPRPMFTQFARTEDVPYPKDNPYSKAKADLGQKLFFDPLLSGSQIVSCSTCHDPDLAWGDGLVRSVGDGMRPIARRSPTLLNLAWAAALFWDGRAETLEDQALEALRSPRVMNMPEEMLATRVKNNPQYREDFKNAFPNVEITPRSVVMAIATFERTLVSGLSPFDRWNLGDQQAISASAKRGFQVFTTKGACAECHDAWRFTDDSFHDIGLPDADLGRGAIVPGVALLQHAFKTPTLRNVALRAPYMHNGSLKTLEDVVEHYNKGGSVARTSLSTSVKPLNLTAQEKQDLVKFMEALTSEY
jgi:cytochrome c peroxidase